MLPAIVGDHGPSAVEGVRRLVQANEEARANRRVDVVEAEALVGDDPGHDRWMVSIAKHQLHPFGLQPAFGKRRMLVEAGHLRPDKKAQAVGPVQPARILRLLVLAGAVEAERLRELDVAPDRRVAGRSQKAAWEVALVENQALQERLAVQPEAAVSGFDLAQPEMAVDTVCSLAVLIDQRGFELVEPGRIWMPRHRMIQLHLASAGRSGPPAHDGAVESRDQLRLTLGLELEIDQPGCQVRAHPKAPDVARRQRLQPHRLPDARRRRVEDALRALGPVLLAARDRPVAERVYGLDDEHVVPSARDVRDVGGERAVAALMAGDLDVVDPDGAAVVDRPEMQEQAFCIGRIEPTPVPDHVAGQPADPGEVRFRAKGNEDAPIEGGLLAGAELPFAVEVEPFRALEVGSRVLWPGPLRLV